MNLFERYQKNTIESFAHKTIGLSYDSRYLFYNKPVDTDNFDFLSSDGKKAVEITLVITKNEKAAYEYEKQKNKGKDSLDTSRIKEIKLKDNGLIETYYGGSISELKQELLGAIEKKNKKAMSRLYKKKDCIVDLCVCIDDGGMLDLYSFELINIDYSSFIFDNYFFITSSRFICYNKKEGYQERTRIIEYE